MLSAAFGVGGAVLSTPGVRLLGVSALEAVGTTLPSILPSAAAGTTRYWRAGLVNWPVVATTAPIGAVAAIVGSFLTHEVPGNGHWLMVATAALLGLTAVRIVRTSPAAAVLEGSDQEQAEAGRSSLAGRIGIGAAGGLLSGLLGVGGGAILLPGFLQVLRLPTKEAVATSLACVGILAVPSTIAHAYLGDINWPVALLLTVGVVPGARVGAAAALRASDRRLRLAVAAMMGVLAVVYGVSELRSALN